jgi:hypothetical protein
MSTVRTKVLFFYKEETVIFEEVLLHEYVQNNHIFLY